MTNNNFDVDAKPPRTSSTQATNQRVLLVDDNAEARQTLAKVLQMWGHIVEEAADGPTCLAKAPAFSPDVIVLDIGMPRMDGYEVLMRLRKSPQFSTARIVALTGYGSKADKKKAADAGFDAHFTKPAVLDELRRRLFSN